MTTTASATLAVVIEREIPYPPEKVWRALTQPHRLAEWLMQNDFQPVMNHRFKFSADWGAVDCEVIMLEPNRMLSYTWAAMGLKSVVTWTLTAAGKGTRLRMEHTGFSADRQQQVYYNGAKAGWQKFFANLEQVLARVH